MAALRYNVIDPGACERTYSSVYKDQSCGSNNAAPTLSSNHAWTAKNAAAGEWMTMDAGSLMEIHGVRTKVKDDGSRRQWITQFTVDYSTDNATWSSVDGGAIFLGPPPAPPPPDIEAATDAVFASPVSARYIRITAQAFAGWVAIRAGLLSSEFSCAAVPVND